MSAKSFIQMCLDGDALDSEIDEFVRKWHASSSEETLQQFLGMTDEEYNAWVLDDSVLPLILKARRYGEPFSRVIQENIERIPTDHRSNR